MKTRVVALLLALSVLPVVAPAGAQAACLPDPAGVAMEATGRAPFTEDPDAGWWKTWHVPANAVSVPAPPASSSTETAGELAELTVNSTRRTSAQLAAIARWDEGAAAHPWVETFLGIIAASSARPDKNPPRISRDIGIVQTAIFDALAVVWRAKHCYRRPAPWAVQPSLQTAGTRRAAPSYPSEHAAVAGAMKVLMPALYGVDVGFEVAEAVNTRLWAGLNYRSDLAAGQMIGAAVARAVLAARANDGSGRTWDGSGRITGKCNWEPTPPAFTYPPLEPVWGSVRPFLMTSGSQFRPGPPPACDSAEYLSSTRDLYDTSRSLTQRQKDIAKYWAGGPGTETPPGMNGRAALEAAHEHGLSTMRQARLLAHVGASLADAAIAAWDAKFVYWGDRPVIGIRRLIDRDWTSFIGTPPFPGYVSGHATFSGAAMAVLAGFLPDIAIECRAMASEAAMSRFYGGIHIRQDNEVGLDLGGKIAALALARAAGDGADTVVPL